MNLMANCIVSVTRSASGEGSHSYRKYESYDNYEWLQCTGSRWITCDSNGAGYDGQQGPGAHVQRTAARDPG